MISYAQYGEDVRLARACPESSGIYVDIGACHPTIDSVTRHFYGIGWRGINVEPIQSMWKRLCDERPEDLNVQAAISGAEGELELAVVEGALPRSTVESSALAELKRLGVSWKTQKVPAITLAELANRFLGGRDVDFLKIDVEGHESQVVHGNDWRVFRPKILVIEAVAPQTKAATHAVWEGRLSEAEYRFACSDGINRFYVRDENAELAEVLAGPVTESDRAVPMMRIAQWRWIRDRLHEARISERPIRSMAQIQRFLGMVEADPELLLENPHDWNERWRRICA